MARSYFELYIHFIWTVKYRESLLTLDIEKSVTEVIKVKAEKYKATLMAIGNTMDHIHLLVSIHPDTVISGMVKEMKASSSYFVNHNMGKLFYWQDTYGALSVSKKDLNRVREYVLNQKEHHNQNKTVPLYERYDDYTG